MSIKPPVTTSEVDDLAKVLPFGLPAPLRSFYTEASAGCKCRYHWSPGKESLVKVREVFPHQYSLTGGPHFIPATELLDAHGVHTWWNGARSDGTEKQAKARAMWRQTVPFIHVGNGDFVAIHVTDDRQSLPVVYLCHDDENNPVTLLSPSFDQFLSDWELLCYVGPEIWLLSAFMGEEGQGPLVAEGEKVRRWRELINGNG